MRGCCFEVLERFVERTCGCQPNGRTPDLDRPRDDRVSEGGVLGLFVGDHPKCVAHDLALGRVRLFERDGRSDRLTATTFTDGCSCKRRERRREVD